MIHIRVTDCREARKPAWTRAAIDSRSQVRTEIGMWPGSGLPDAAIDKAREQPDRAQMPLARM